MAAARCCARGWWTCAPPSASPASNTAKPSPRPPRPPPPAASPRSPPCPTPRPRSTIRRWCACWWRAARRPAASTSCPTARVTRGCRGEEMAELGLLREAGAVAFTDGARAIGPARLMALALSYARGFGGRIVQHPEEPSLAAGGAATARRTGDPARPARHPGRGRGDHGGARHPAGAADRRRGAFRPCLDRRGAGADPPCQGRRACP